MHGNPNFHFILSFLSSRFARLYPLRSLFLSYLELTRPDGLEDTLLGGKTTEGVVSFGSETDGTRDGEGNGFTGVTTFRIDFSNV